MAEQGEGETKIVELPTRLEGESTVEYLKRLEATGNYLFHGSDNRGILVLEPRKPIGVSDNGDSWTNDTAVYAVCDIETAISRAITPNRIELKGDWSITMGDTENPTVPSLIVSSNVFERIGNGVVYVITREGFEQKPDGSKQYKNRNPVNPVATIGVTPADFIKLGGVIREK